MGRVCRSGHTRTSPQPDLLMGIMWHRWRFGASSSLAPHPQRHITPNATEEIKLDGYRAIAVKSGDRVNLCSRTLAISGFQDFKSRLEEISIGCWPFNTCKLNAASRAARCSSMSQLLVVSSLARWEIAASAMADLALPGWSSHPRLRSWFAVFKVGTH